MWYLQSTHAKKKILSNKYIITLSILFFLSLSAKINLKMNLSDTYMSWPKNETINMTNKEIQTLLPNFVCQFEFPHL